MIGEPALVVAVEKGFSEKIIEIQGIVVLLNSNLRAESSRRLANFAGQNSEMIK